MELRAVRAEEDDVGRLERVDRQAECGRNLAAHRRRSCGPAGSGSARARPGTAAACRHARRSPEQSNPPGTTVPSQSVCCGLLGRPRPDVRVADEPKRAGQHRPLPCGQLRERERRRLGQHLLLLPVRDRQRARERVRSLGARGRLCRQRLELVLCSRVVQPADRAGARRSPCRATGSGRAPRRERTAGSPERRASNPSAATRRASRSRIVTGLADRREPRSDAPRGRGRLRAHPTSAADRAGSRRRLGPRMPFATTVGDLAADPRRR